MRSKEREAEKKNESEKKEKSTAQNILGTIAYIVGVCVFVFLILHFVGQRTVVNGSSMDTTLANGQNLVMDKLSYRFHDPERYQRFSACPLRCYWRRNEKGIGRTWNFL